MIKPEVASECPSQRMHVTSVFEQHLKHQLSSKPLADCTLARNVQNNTQPKMRVCVEQAR
jgi:hypothetical protein